MVLHPLEDDHAVAGRADLLAIDFEAGRLAQAVARELGLDQPLGAVLERLLDLADADAEQAPLAEAIVDQLLGEEMRLARSPPALGALVARRRQQRLEHRSGRELKDGQSCA